MRCPYTLLGCPSVTKRWLLQEGHSGPSPWAQFRHRPWPCPSQASERRGGRGGARGAAQGSQSGSELVRIRELQGAGPTPSPRRVQLSPGTAVGRDPPSHPRSSRDPRQVDGLLLTPRGTAQGAAAPHGAAVTPQMSGSGGHGACRRSVQADGSSDARTGHVFPGPVPPTPAVLSVPLRVHGTPHAWGRPLRGPLHPGAEGQGRRQGEGGRGWAVPLPAHTSGGDAGSAVREKEEALGRALSTAPGPLRPAPAVPGGFLASLSGR